MGASKEFTADTDIIEVSTYTQINNIFVSGGSVNFWILIEGTGLGSTSPTILLKGDNDFGWRVYQTDVFEIVMQQRFDTFGKSWTTDSTISLDEWTNVTINYNSDSTTNDADIYFNNSLQTVTSAGSPSGSAASDSAFPLNMGDSFSSVNGKISYIQLFDRELAQPEIKEIMHKPGSIRDGLVGFWPMTDDGSTQRNLSGIGNTGAVTGATNSTDGPPVTCFK